MQKASSFKRTLGIQSVQKNHETKLPPSYWKSVENRKNFLEGVVIKFNLQKPKDWGKITVQNIYDCGGSPLLNKYYKGSLIACLQSVYAGIIFFNQL